MVLIDVGKYFIEGDQYKMTDEEKTLRKELNALIRQKKEVK